MFLAYERRSDMTWLQAWQYSTWQYSTSATASTYRRAVALPVNLLWSICIFLFFLATAKHVWKDLMVFLIADGDTLCTTNVSDSGTVRENETITVSCSITYSGNWAPVMRWTDSATSNEFNDDIITNTTNNTSVTSQLTVTASAGLHGSEIVCDTYFTQSAISLPEGSATNVPSYTYKWMSPTINIGK